MCLAEDFNLGGDISWQNNSIAPGSKYINQCQKLLDMCTTYNLEQLVTDPTRHDKTLDLFFTTNPTLINYLKVLPGFGDHDMVPIEANISPKAPPRPVRRRVFLYLKGNFTELKSELMDFGTSFLATMKERSVEDNWDKIKSKLLALVARYIPNKLSSTRYNLPWFNRKLRKLNRKVQRLYNAQKQTQSESDKVKYRQTRRAYKRKLNESYWKYTNDLLDSSISEQPKRFWSFVKSKRQDSVGIHSMEHNNVTLSNSLVKANILNNFFSSIFTQESTLHIPKLHPCQHTPAIRQITITSLGVQKLLSSLNPNKSSGPDNIPVRILKETSNELAPIFI